MDDDGENNHPKLTILEDYEYKPSNVGKHVDYGISILEKNCTLFVPKDWCTECVFGEIMQKTPLSAVRYYDHNMEKESGYEMIISAIVKK